MSIWRTWCACVCTLDGAGSWVVDMGVHVHIANVPFSTSSPPRALSFQRAQYRRSVFAGCTRPSNIFTIYNTAAYIYLQYGRILFTIRPPHIFASIPAPAHALSGGQTARLRRNRERLNSSFCEMTSCRKTGERRSCGNFRRRSAVQR